MLKLNEGHPDSNESDSIDEVREGAEELMQPVILQN